MYKTPEQFLSTANANLDIFTTVAKTAFAASERLAALNLNTVRAALDNAVDSARNFSAPKDPQAFAAQQAALVQPAIEAAVAYSRSVYEIANEAKVELSKVFEGQYAELNKAVSTAIDTAAKNAPAGSDAAVAAVKSAIQAANSAFDTLSKSAKQVAEIAEANIADATKATVKAVSAKTKKAA